jgi:uncharacterized delta-60 repeat protein
MRVSSWGFIGTMLAALSGCGSGGSDQASENAGQSNGGSGPTGGVSTSGGNTHAGGASTGGGANAAGTAQGGDRFDAPPACKAPAVGSPGELDAGFDAVEKDVGLLRPEVIVSDRKGRYLVTGRTGLNGLPLMVARFTASGALDATFADNGIYRLELSPEFQSTSWYATSDDQDRIWVGGASKQDIAKPEDAFVLRLEESGELDPTFNAGGVLPGTLVFRPRYLSDQWVSEDAQVSYIIPTAGGAWLGGYPPFIDRIEDDGSFEPSFQAAALGSLSWSKDTLFLGGETVRALDAQGTLRPEFGVDGALELYVPGSTTNRFTTGAPIPQGPDNLLLFGSGAGGNRVARITRQGKLDKTFGDNGFSAAFSCGLTVANVGCDGLIVAAGEQARPLPDPNQYCAVVLTPDGKPIAGTPAEGQFSWPEPETAADESSVIDASIDLATNSVVYVHARTSNIHLVRVNLPR